MDKEDKEDKKDVKWLVGVGNKKGYPFIRKRFSPFFLFFQCFCESSPQSLHFPVYIYIDGWQEGSTG